VAPRFQSCIAAAKLDPCAAKTLVMARNRSLVFMRMTSLAGWGVVLDADQVRLEWMIDEQAVERLADGTTKTKSRFFEEAVEGLWLGDRR
jgi:hypothetical protein